MIESFLFTLSSMQQPCSTHFRTTLTRSLFGLIKRLATVPERALNKSKTSIDYNEPSAHDHSRIKEYADVLGFVAQSIGLQWYEI